MKSFTLTLERSGSDIPEHNPAGEEVQMHELPNGDVVLTFNPDFLEFMDWQPEDILTWNINEEPKFFEIINVTMEERKKLREQVKQNIESAG